MVLANPRSCGRWLACKSRYLARVLLEGRDLHGLAESERARLLGLVLTERGGCG